MSELTENGYNLIILDDLQWPRDDKAEWVETLSLVEEHVSWGPVAQCEVDSQGAQTAVTGESEGCVLVEHMAVQVNTDVGLHVRRTVVQHLHTHILTTL